VPILIVSLLHSKLLTIPAGDSWPVLGFPLIFDVVRKALAMLGSHSAAAQVRATQLYISPSAMAAWVGMLATSLNLLPGGQLDGGHIVFALSPRYHRLISALTMIALLILSWFVWTGWLLWAVVLLITTSRHPMVPLHPGLPRRSRILALVAALMLAITLIPAPVAEMNLRQAYDAILHEIRGDQPPSK
jgi:membrane-associated protease RseP (regulator of RpoE activity)